MTNSREYTGHLLGFIGLVAAATVIRATNINIFLAILNDIERQRYFYHKQMQT